MPEKGGPGPPKPSPASPPVPVAPAVPAVQANGAGGTSTSAPSNGAPRAAAAPLKPKVAAPAPSAAPVKPLAIPTITWTSAPPPIAPRSFSTPPPPPPSPELATERPPEVVATAAVLPPAPVLPPIESVETREARARTDGLRRGHELREEARALLQQTLEEALAPLHFAVRDLERRLTALEQQPAAAPLVSAPPRPTAAAPTPIVARAAGIMPPPAVAISAPQIIVAPAPRAPSFDYGVAPFDGARRRRRVVGLFVFFLVLVFGALFGTLIASWMEPR